MAALMKNDMKPSPIAVLLLKRLLVLSTQVHHPRHVGFVEGGQDRGGLLGFDQALGDLLAEPAHALASFSRPPSWSSSLARPGPAGSSWPERSPGPERPSASRGLRGFEVGEDVSLGDAAAGAGGGDAGDVDLVLGDHPADGRRQPNPAPSPWPCAAWRRPAARPCGGPTIAAAVPAPMPSRAFRPGRSCRRSRRSATVSPSATRDLQDPRARRRHDAAGLVGLELEERLARP